MEEGKNTATTPISNGRRESITKTTNVAVRLQSNAHNYQCLIEAERLTAAKQRI